MKCKNKNCALRSGHEGRCHSLVGDTRADIVQVGTERRKPPVTITYTACNHCVTKDAEIERLRNQLLQMAEERISRPMATYDKPKRDRAAYMKKYRGRTKSGNSAAAD